MVYKEIEKEILENYNNPIYTLEMYYNINHFYRESKILITSLCENLDGYIRSSINQNIEKFIVNYNNFELLSKNQKNDYFITDDIFETLLRVVVFEHHKSYNTRKTEKSNVTKEYCLFFKGYRIKDEYLQSILPNKKIENYSFYNDSTPMDNFDEVKFYLSILETERFLEKYNKIEHCRILFDGK